LGEVPQFRQRVLALCGVETVQLLFKLLDVGAHAKAKFIKKDRAGVSFFSFFKKSASHGFDTNLEEVWIKA
jgi:hypothetical protein